jgi:hypothetical protein
MSTHHKPFKSTQALLKSAEVVFALTAEHTRGNVLEVRVCPKTGTTWVIIEQAGDRIEVGSQNAGYSYDLRDAPRGETTWGRSLKSMGKDARPVEVVYLGQPGRKPGDLDLSV